MSLVEIVSNLASLGLPCFPCLDNKGPACPGGFKAATTNQQELIKLWTCYPGSLIGVPTGALSGFNVLDIDPRHGGEQWLVKVKNDLPITRMHHTRSGGWHFLFRHCTGLRNSAGKLAAGVDVRAEGGYIIWWPSLGYSTDNAHILEPWPDWLLEKLLGQLSQNGEPEQRQRNAEANYIQIALRKSALSVARAYPGSRNETLNKEVFSLSRFVETGGLDPKLIAETLAIAALEAGLSKNEVVSTIGSALRARGIR